MELLAKIKDCFNTLGESKKTRILEEFSKHPFVDNQFDLPRLYNMCTEAQEKLLLKENLIQEDDDDDGDDDDAKLNETVELVEKTKKILDKLGEDKKTMILKECVSLPGHDVDFMFVYERALAELANIKGKKTIFEDKSGDRAKTIPIIQKPLHDSIKIGKRRARSDEDDDYEKEKARTNKRRLAIVAVQYNSDDLPDALKQIMARENGTNEVLVIQKQLSQTDVNPHNARLSLPLSQVNEAFLSHEEKEFLFQETSGGEKKPRREAKLLEPSSSGKVCTGPTSSLGNLGTSLRPQILEGLRFYGSCN